MNKLKIFISGPYSAPTEEERLNNTIRVVDIGLDLIKMGHAPFMPHLMHWTDHRANERGIVMTWEDYMSWDDTWLQECDAILYIGSSYGSDIELHRAKELGLQVFTSIQEVEQATPAITNQEVYRNG